MRESGELIERGRKRLFHVIRKNLGKPNLSESMLKDAIIEDLRAFLFEQTERYPMIIPMLVIV